MCKIVETRWTKEELEGYIKCNYEQLLYIAKNQFKSIALAGYKDKPITYKASVIAREIFMRSHSQALIDKVLTYFHRISYFTGLLEGEVYKEGD